MTPKDYILGKLKGIKEPQDKAPILSDQNDLVNFIYAAIMSKKFRKYSVDSKTKDNIRKAIELNVQSNDPIKVAIPYGTYKLWRFEESPEPDWAELFAMIYYAYWLKPITEIYKPGVWFDFAGDDAVLEMMNNIPEADTLQYKKIMRSLISFIQTYLPANFKYTFSSVSERYNSKEEFSADLEDKIKKLREKTLPPLTDAQIADIKLNIRPIPGKELDLEENRIIHDAYLDVSKRRPHHKKPETILVCATPFPSNSLPIGTTKTSVVKYQTGVGVLKKKDDSFIEYIYSPLQLQNSKFEWAEIAIEGLTDKNFNKIRIVR